MRFSGSVVWASVIWSSVKHLQVFTREINTSVNFYSWVSVNPLSNNLSLKFTKKKKFKSFLSFEHWSLWVRHSTLQVVSHFFSEYVREHVDMQLLPQDEFHAWLQAYPLLMFLEKNEGLILSQFNTLKTVHLQLSICKYSNSHWAQTKQQMSFALGICTVCLV